MDYLSFLPIEIWTTILRTAVDESIDEAPSDPVQFCLLESRLASGINSIPLRGGRNSLRSVCCGFKDIIGDYKKAGSRRLTILETHRVDYGASRFQSVMTLIIRVKEFNIGRDLESLWSHGKLLPNLRTLSVDGASNSPLREITPTWITPFWKKMNEAFPRLVTLYLRLYWMEMVPGASTYDGGVSVVLRHLRHLYMPGIGVFDLPHFPELRSLQLGRTSKWEAVYDSAPRLETLALSGGYAPLRSSLIPGNIRCLRCSLQRALLLPGSRHVEVLVLDIPPDISKLLSAIPRVRSLSGENDIAIAMQRAQEIFPSARLHLNLQRVDAIQRPIILKYCEEQGLDVTTTDIAEQYISQGKDVAIP